MGHIKKNFTLIFFGIIFLIYFLSANGLYNSMDSTQYFTAKALIEHQNLDLSPYSTDPHYFVYPDIYYNDDQTLSIRGYMVSILSIPFHLSAPHLFQLESTNNFDPAVTNAPLFKTELLISSLFPIFTVIGLYLIFKGLEILKIKPLINYFIIFILGFGTYIWKYAAAYTRHGVIVLLISMAIYGYSKWRYKNSKFGIFIVLLSLSLSFGVDIMLFLALSSTILIFIAYRIFLLVRGKETLHFDIKTIIKIVLLPLIIVISNVILNYYWYGTFIYSQTEKVDVVKSVLKDDYDGAWTSTELIPATTVVLFNSGKLPENVFTNFNNLPDEVGVFASLSYAKRYDFYGLFIVSPIFLISIFGVINKKIRNKYKELFFLCFCLFVLGICANAKVLNFWGGNQYDIRYFYPYVLLLAPGLAFALENVKSNVRAKKIIASVGILLLTIISILMSWFGVLNMFKTSLTGERKIWVDSTTISNIFTEHSFNDFLFATFPNLENILLGAGIIIVAFVIIKLLRHK